MKRYPAYKDSGIEWIGEIPEHWVPTKLKYIAEIETGTTPPKADQDNYENGTFLWVKPDELLAFIPITDSKEKLTDKGKHTSRIIPKGSVLVSCIGTIGKIGVAGCELSTNQQINSVIFNRPNTSETYGKYLLFCMEKEHQRNATIVVVPILNKRNQSNLKFAIPSGGEQEAISLYLDHKTRLIDTLIEKKQKQIELLQEQRTAIINQAVTKGLNPSVKMKDTGIEWLGTVPEHWDISKLKYVAKSVATGKTPPTSETEYYDDGIIDWFSPGDFRNGLYLSNSKRKITNKAISDGKALLYEPKSVLLVGIGATLGKVGIIEKQGSSNQQINAITFQEVFNPHFGLYYLFSITDTVISFANSATLPILNQSQTKDISIVVPPKKEQDEIMLFLQHIEHEISSSSVKILRQIELLKEYHTTLISEVVTGKIDVRDEVIP